MGFSSSRDFRLWCWCLRHIQFFLVIKSGIEWPVTSVDLVNCVLLLTRACKSLNKNVKFSISHSIWETSQQYSLDVGAAVFAKVSLFLYWRLWHVLRFPSHPTLRRRQHCHLALRSLQHHNLHLLLWTQIIMNIMLVSLNIAKICLTKLNFTCVSAALGLPCRDEESQILITFHFKVESFLINFWCDATSTDTRKVNFFSHVILSSLFA